MPDLSICIVNYNTRDALRRCLASIQAHSGALEVETLVVDNGSKDGSVEMIRSEFPSVTLIIPGHNTWFNGGNNVALSQARGDYAFLLNPDTVLEPATLETLIGYLKAHPQVGAAACLMRYPGTRALQMTCSQLPRYLDLLLGYTFLGALFPRWRAARRRAMWYDGWDRLSTRAVEVVPDSCMMAPLPLLQRLQGLDSHLKLYFTEDDLCQRIRAAGYEIHYVAEAMLWHEEHASVSQVQRLATQVYFDDLIAFTRKYYGDVRARLLWALITPTRWAMDLAQRLRGERRGL